jgi:hypothetical protein
MEKDLFVSHNFIPPLVAFVAKSGRDALTRVKQHRRAEGAASNAIFFDVGQGEGGRSMVEFSE